ncbi:TetR/AcrR family transcriptional regulator [Alcanivorax limicola]|uniref:TetR/AcrR family transcriptional regulator n=1 Tax=Alcanivorax limicola TaxID=2874102 RepID=UPI001CBDA0B9|nr:TetR/AcrR family transcriptional regulator [Alcanivorax limicola]
MSTSGKSKPSDNQKDPRYHHGNLRRALVDAALGLMVETGGTSFSLREAARRVGVTVNASYRHFRNKDALMVAIAAEGFRRFSQALMDGAATGSSARDRLLGSGRAYVRFARANPSLFRLMFGSVSAGDAGREDEELVLAGSAALDVLKSGLAAFMNKPPESPAVTVAALRAWALAHGLSYLLLDGQLAHLPLDPDALIDQVISADV